jgi:RNA recognition motif-containing protein
MIVRAEPTEDQIKKEKERVYVGNYDPRRVRESDLKDAFRRFGKIREVIIKQGFAFIGFEELRDAEDVSCLSDRLIVEFMLEY